MPQPFCAQHYFVLLETDDIQRGQNLKKGHLLVGNQKGKVEAEKEEQSQQPNNPTTRLKQTHRQPTPTHTTTLRRRRRRRRRGRRNRTESWRGREERKGHPFCAYIQTLAQTHGAATRSAGACELTKSRRWRGQGWRRRRRRRRKGRQNRQHLACGKMLFNARK